ncbi:hypothetical protein M9Y10_008609 [Tritrichomonas musculus]|uniref:COPI associated protein n=1 Tax=Tritrichomonas musculus TaxID=1915356 RepID=A0ABR2IZC7_9EUKA
MYYYQNSRSCNFRFIIQIACIIVGVFGIIAAIVIMAKYAHGFFPIIRSLITLLLCVALICVEVYLFPFVKYFGFIIKTGGKALSYLFIGGCLFANSGFPLFCAILYWILAVAFGIMAFLVPNLALPLLQGGYKDGELPDLSLTASELYQGQDNQQYKSILHQDIAEEVQ